MLSFGFSYESTANIHFQYPFVYRTSAVPVCSQSTLQVQRYVRLICRFKSAYRCGCETAWLSVSHYDVIHISGRRHVQPLCICVVFYVLITLWLCHSV